SAPGLVVVVSSPRPAGDAARTRDECYITYVRRGTRPAARTGPRRPSPPRSPPAAAARGPDGYDGRPDPRRTGTPTLPGRAPRPRPRPTGQAPCRRRRGPT